MGLSLDGLIIEEVLPKLPASPPDEASTLSLSKPIDQQLILSIRAPVAKEDLLEIKRPKSSPLFFLEEPESEPVNKNPWDLAVESIKGKDTHYRVSQQVLG